MDALEAVIDLVKQNEELAHTVDAYEEWFESLVGRAVTISRTHKKKTEFITGEVEEFEPGEGWICLLYTSPSPRDRTRSRMPSSA